MAMPKEIQNHPGVETCEHEDDTDYRYSVWLKPGWVFENGRNAGNRGSRFQTVAQFRLAHPVRL